MNIVKPSKTDRRTGCNVLWIASVVFLIAEFVFYLALVPHRPTAQDRFERSLPGGPWANVIGQAGWWQLSYGAFLIVVLYALKMTILRNCDDSLEVLGLFGLSLLACLPILWVFVTTDWNNAHAELAYWLTL